MHQKLIALVVLLVIMLTMPSWGITDLHFLGLCIQGG